MKLFVVVLLSIIGTLVQGLPPPAAESPPSPPSDSASPPSEPAYPPSDSASPPSDPAYPPSDPTSPPSDQASYGKDSPDHPEGAVVVPLAPKNPYDIQGDTVDKGGDVSKACRYDEPEWSNCDPFELIRFKTLHLVSGGRQCEEVKNITEKCSPFDLPPGTKWLIAEHRRCIAELKRLKLKIADIAKYITVLREQGTTLFNSYLVLKKHLDHLRGEIEEMQRQLAQSQEKTKALRAEIETWKEKAAELQGQLDELKNNYHDLQKEHKDGAQKQKECDDAIGRNKGEITKLQAKLTDMKTQNTELQRRLMDAQKYKDQLAKINSESDKMQLKHDKLVEKLEGIQDDVASCKIDSLSKTAMNDELSYKDTKLDLSMEMWIVHNRSEPVELNTTPYTLAPPITTMNLEEEEPTCLISYYGITNETCWYSSNSESAEADFQDTLGEHKVEAHWKYFTISVKDQYECDKAAHLHYEFLINRCEPHHHLPVLSIYRPNKKDEQLATHIYPRPNIPQPNQPNRCWITFLGPHGHCERRKEKYPLYNSDDTVEGYRHGGSGVSKSKCLGRAQIWTNYCENPAIATYLPEGLSSNWHDNDIQHDNHGGRMFEQKARVKNQINPHSINPHNVTLPNNELPEVFEDTPEYRKALNMENGKERDQLLASLKERLEKSGVKVNPGSGDVQWDGENGEHGHLPAEAGQQAPAQDYKQETPAPAYETPAPAPETPAYETPGSAPETPAPAPEVTYQKY